MLLQLPVRVVNEILDFGFRLAETSPTQAKYQFIKTSNFAIKKFRDTK
jgi:hypothetical protein